jgi:hypothetical protein
MEGEKQVKFITVATFSHQIEAHLAKAKLESEGLECRLADEHIVSINWLFSDAVGGIKLRVSEKDAERAREILRRGPAHPDRIGVSPGEEVEGSRCPVCSSTEVHGRGILSFLASFLPFDKRSWECRRCGYHWEED